MLLWLVTLSGSRLPFGPDDGPARRRADEIGNFGLALLLISLGVFFAAAVILIVVLRSSPQFLQPALPLRLPPGIWLSTLLLLFSSVLLHCALVGIRAGRTRALRAGLAGTSILAGAFLVSQTLNWLAMAEAGVLMASNLYAWLFYTLTALHALHVVGGLIPLLVVTCASFAGRYSARRHSGVRYCAYYWHFLGGVWLALLLALSVPT